MLVGSPRNCQDGENGCTYPHNLLVRRGLDGGHGLMVLQLSVQVNVPKTKRAFCKDKNCKKHTMHKVTQYKTGKASLYAQGVLLTLRRAKAVGERCLQYPQHISAPAGKRRYDRKQSGYGGQTKPVFHKKVHFFFNEACYNSSSCLLPQRLT